MNSIGNTAAGVSPNMDNLKKLQDEAVALANRIDAVRAIEGDGDKIAERDLELKEDRV